MSEITSTAISVAPGRDPGDRWILRLYGEGLDVEELAGFPNFWSAWAFAVAHGLPDPVVNHPGHNARLRTLRPPAVASDAKPTQARLIP